jgi:two-component system NtrC family sensor kinase
VSLAQAILAVPILVSERAIGVLSVANQTAARTFHEHDVHLMTILSDYAAIALENARLYAAKENERQQLDTILRDTQDAVIVTDADLRIVLANHAACSAFDLKTEPHGMPLSEAIDNNAVLNLFTKGRQHTHARRSEIPLADGRTLQGQLSHLSGIGFGVVMQDISQLKELDRIKSEFISTVSHDLRTPLTSIRGYIGLLPRVGPLNEQQQDFVARVDRSMNNIVELINDLLNISHIESGMDWEMAPLDLHNVIEDSVAALQQSASDKNQTLRLDAATLPPLIGNAQRLKQVVDNLISNAIKYTPDGGHIDVQLHEQGDFLTLQVRDTGIGIAPADQSRIFEKFYRAQSDQTMTISGTGLGLSIVQAIVERHKGRVWVESKEGRGSTFTVLLPRDASTYLPDMLTPQWRVLSEAVR